MNHHPPGPGGRLDAERLLMTLAGDLATLDTAVASLVDQVAAGKTTSTRVDALAAVVAELVDQVKKLQAGPDKAELAPWCWATLPTEEAAAAWEELADWTTHVVTTGYEALAIALLPCWPVHPAVLEEVTRVYFAWRAAYDNPRARPIDLSDLLDRALPNAVSNIQAVFQDTGCSDREHAEDKFDPKTLVTGEFVPPQVMPPEDAERERDRIQQEAVAAVQKMADDLNQ